MTISAGVDPHGETQDGAQAQHAGSSRASWQWLSAAAVHVYTAAGSVLALLIVVAAFNRNELLALWLTLAALVIDGTDGMLARAAKVKERIPSFDGALLDNIVDYLTYVFAPVVLLWTGGYLPDGPAGMVVASLPLLSSSYQFCRTDAKTDDHFFLGFPSYWNVVAFYAIVTSWSPMTLAVVLVVCSALVFVPIRYLYPSRTEAFRTLNISLTVVWLVAYAVIVAQMPEPSAWWVGLSLAYLAYYIGISLYLTAKGAAARRRAAATA